MKQRLISLAVYKAYRMKIMSHEDLRKMKYGMEVVSNELIKTILLLVLFAAMNKLNYFLFSLIILVSIRCSSGGLHFQSNLSCLMFSCIFFLASTYEAAHVVIAFRQLTHSMLLFSIAAIGLLSPLPSINRPIKDKRKQRLLKINAVFITALWSYILLYEFEATGLAACGIITITLQALQLIAGYVIKRWSSIIYNRGSEVV